MEVDIETQSSISCKIIYDKDKVVTYLLIFTPNLYIHFGLIDPTKPLISEARIYTKPTEIQFLRAVYCKYVTTDASIRKMKATFERIKNVCLVTDVRLYCLETPQGKRYYDDFYEYYGSQANGIHFNEDGEQVFRLDYQFHPWLRRKLNEMLPKDQIVHIKAAAITCNLDILDQFRTVVNQIVPTRLPDFTSYLYESFVSLERIGKLESQDPSITNLDDIFTTHLLTTIPYVNEQGIETSIKVNNDAEFVIQDRGQFYRVAPTRLTPLTDEDFQNGKLFKFDLDSKEKIELVLKLIHEDSITRFNKMSVREHIVEHKVVHFSYSAARIPSIMRMIKIKSDGKFFCGLHLRGRSTKNEFDIASPLFEVDEDDSLERILGCDKILEWFIKKCDDNIERMKMIANLLSATFTVRDETINTSAFETLDLVLNNKYVYERKNPLFIAVISTIIRSVKDDS